MHAALGLAMFFLCCYCCASSPAQTSQAPKHAMWDGQPQGCLAIPIAFQHSNSRWISHSPGPRAAGGVPPGRRAPPHPPGPPPPSPPAAPGTGGPAGDAQAHFRGMQEKCWRPTVNTGRTTELCATVVNAITSMPPLHRCIRDDCSSISPWVAKPPGVPAPCVCKRQDEVQGGNLSRLACSRAACSARVASAMRCAPWLAADSWDWRVRARLSAPSRTRSCAAHRVTSLNRWF